jgi:AraC-like DNA-binding protein/mannose-6-phosphate isomerase-like protein (cupin superfamily)
MARKKFWIYYNSSNVLEDFCIDEFGVHNAEAGYAFSEKRINHIFQFVVKGVCHLTVGKHENARHYEVREGEAFIIRAGTPHSYVSDEKEGCTRYWLSFSGKRSEEVLRRCGIREEQVVIEGIDCVDLTKRYNAFYKCIRSEGEHSFKILSNASAILDRLVKANVRCEKENIGSFSDRQLIVKAVMEYVTNNLSENLNVKDIAYKFGYERSHLYRLFLEENGCSIQRYIIICRINRARYLLVETEMPIYEIAHEVGYESYAAFSKVFIREANLTPSEYRKYNAHKKGKA